MSPRDWLDPEAIPSTEDALRGMERLAADIRDEYCPDCTYLESEHRDGICPTEAEVRERWGK